MLIDVPKDVQAAKCEYTPMPRRLNAGPEPKAAKDVRIRGSGGVYQYLRKTVYILRRRCDYFGEMHEEEMLAVADKIDAPIGCSMMGLSGIPTDHPRFLGMHGMHGHYASSMAMHHADLIISLGVRFNDRATGRQNEVCLKVLRLYILI